LIRFYGPSRHSENIYSVYTDGKCAMKTMLDHLFSFGHRRIGFLSDLPKEEEFRRVSGYAQAFLEYMHHAGLKADPDSSMAFREDGDVTGGIARLCRSDITAFLCVNEAYGPQAAQVIKKLGYRIPGDFSFLAHESFEVSQYLSPPHSCCLQDFPAMASAAFDLLERLVRGESVAEDVSVACTLIARASVAASRRRRLAVKRAGATTSNFS
ncbi:MAG: substrate-binding domain-containing protein, partial [Victivallaceae bacterium]|nr:substrate-binding domain-containing protein [Victivallaceae bacterium]